MNKKHSLLFALMISGLVFSIFYLPHRSASNRETVFVSRVIDGDTLALEDGRRIRLLNINTPEKGEYGSDLSSAYLKSFENKSVQIDVVGEDRYQRTLARIYSPEYLNLKIVSSGLAVKFLVSESETKEFAQAEESAIENSLGIWKKSEYFGCISTNIDYKKEIVAIKNSCSPINISLWKIRDESRKSYLFPGILLGSINLHSKNGTDNSTDLFWQSQTNIWNDNRDTLYLLDSENKIVHYHYYGY